MVNDTHLSALLCSRLCHDLVSPVGAMSNGMEILANEQDQGMQAQIIDLLQLSLRQTASRLAFFRLAFGATKSHHKGIPNNQLAQILRDLFRDTKCGLEWRIAAPALPTAAARIILNIALILQEALVRGGDLTVMAQGDDVRIVAQGGRIVLPDSLLAALRGDLDLEEVDARSAPAYLAAQLAQGSDIALTVHLDQEKNGMEVQLKATLTEIN